MELLTVIAIIGILAGIVLGVAGYATGKSDRSKAIAQMEKIKNGLEEYRVNRGTYPPGIPLATSSNQLTNAQFFQNFTNGLPRGYDTSEISQVDPWGNGYWYQREASSAYQYKLWSTGQNRLDDSDNINNWTGQE
ncbi:MAG: type II secretion system protein GspG [Verrucomicrobiota bacterium]